MAFATTTIGNVPGMGSKQCVYGTYTNNGGSTGGDIRTNLNTVEYFCLQPKGAAVSANQSVVNETMPLTNAGGLVTVITNSDEVGQWMAFGY